MEISLHAHQLEIYNDDTRFQVVAAGRRFGKSYLAAVKLLTEASKNDKVRTDGVWIDLQLEEVYYVAPTFEQARKILWPLLKVLGEDLIAQAYENVCELRLINERRISLKGSDNPDSLRGVGLSYVVLDEYAFMREEVWEMIISPALARAEGGALFIGTPAGKNHFYTVWQYGFDDDEPEWASWTFKSIDNPFLPVEEIKSAKKRMSAERFRQEMLATFESGGGTVMTREMFRIIEESEVPPGEDYICADLAGYTSIEGGRKKSRLDDHAIACTRVHAHGWCVRNIDFGRWDTRETSLRLIKAQRKYQPVKYGIEKGMSMNAVLPYLTDQMCRFNTHFEVIPMTHGNQKKTDRIQWALQGRAEKGEITLVRGDWNETFISQACDFPGVLVHDDLIDAVAYTDQIADPYFEGEAIIDDWQPLDPIAGY